MYPRSKRHLYQSLKLNIKSRVAQLSNRQLLTRRFIGCTSVDSTIALASIRRLYIRRIDGCTSVESVVAQASNLAVVKLLNQRLYRASNRRFHKRRFDGCTSVESTVILIILKTVLTFLDVPSVPQYKSNDLNVAYQQKIRNS